MMPLPTVLRAFGCSRSKYNKLKSSGHFNREIPEGAAGVATMIDDETAFDIAVIVILTHRGFSPEDAKARVGEWAAMLARGQPLSPFWVYVGRGSLHPTTANGLRSAIEHQIDGADMPMGEEFRPATDCLVINIQEIRARLAAWSAEFCEQQG